MQIKYDSRKKMQAYDKEARKEAKKNLKNKRKIVSEMNAYKKKNKYKDFGTHFRTDYGND